MKTLETESKIITWEKTKPINDFTDIYLYSNEKLSEFSNIFEFGERVLTVVGSGDQYFTCLLNGVKEIELFDINKAAWDYFCLKFYSIQILSYKEFMQFFYYLTQKKLFGKLTEEEIRSEIKIIKKLRLSLPNDVLDTLDLYFEKRLETNISGCILKEAPIKISYLIKKEYERLQKILRNQRLPIFHNINVLDLWKVLKGNYDLMLLSNIFTYLDMSLEEYKKYIETFRCPQIQMHYDWGYPNLSMQQECGYNGIEINILPQANMFSSNECVYSLKRAKR